MALRQLKQKIQEKEAIVQRKTGNADYKDMELRRRFNRLAGGKAHTECFYHEDDDKGTPPTGRQLYKITGRSEYEGKMYKTLCPSDKPGEECVSENWDPRDPEKSSTCGSTDGNGMCPENCKPLRIYEPSWLR